MRILPLAFLLFATTAMAQQQQPSYTPLDETLVRQARSCETVASQQIADLQQHVTALTKQVADLTKERDALKPAKTDQPVTDHAPIQPPP